MRKVQYDQMDWVQTRSAPRASYRQQPVRGIPWSSCRAEHRHQADAVYLSPPRATRDMRLQQSLNAKGAIKAINRDWQTKIVYT